MRTDAWVGAVTLWPGLMLSLLKHKRGTGLALGDNDPPIVRSITCAFSWAAIRQFTKRDSACSALVLERDLGYALQ